MAQYNSNRRSRPSFGSRPSSSSSSRRPGKAKSSIHPSKFVKTAKPAGEHEYVPDNAFSSFAIHPVLKNNIAAKGYKTPSEIQDKTIPHGLAGSDVIGIANTGTGKTAAFALPILNKLLHSGGQALIIAPTRELAIQIEEQCRLIAKNTGLSGALLIGGMPLSRQIRDLKNGARVIIGTPGRIKDHLQQRTLSLANCNMVVLDEVDRMLDMGFINDVGFILDHMPSTRQSFFFSATLSPEINKLIQNFTHEPVTINVKVGETSENVHQAVIHYKDKNDRLDKLHDLLLKDEVQKALVFGETKYGVERLGKELSIRGFKAVSLHGGKNQGQRKRALDSFREDRNNILVATDVAARGIDVSGITHVVNFDVPQTYEDYIHRIGRAGRAGEVGYAFTFVADSHGY
jgi:superfamily II DNA/RNA helicase